MEHQPGGLSLPLLKRDEQDIRAETIVSPFGNSETIIGICEKIMIRPHHRKWGHLAAALVLITTQVVFVSLSGVENGKVQNTPWGAALWVRGICFAMQVVTAVYFFIVSLREVHTFVLSDIWVHYFATGLNFGGVYMFMYTCDPASLAASPGIFDSKTDAFDIGMGMVYFSFSTQTLVGYGDIISSKWYAVVLCSTQMCLAVLYQAVFVSQTVNNMEEAGYAERNSSMFDLDAQPDDKHLASLRRSVEQGKLSHCEAMRKYFRTIHKRQWFITMRRWTRKHMAPLIIAIQAILVLLMYVRRLLHFLPYWVRWIETIASTVSMLVLILASFKFVNKSNHITLGYLVSVYGALVLIFAGVQTSLLTDDPTSWVLPFGYDTGSTNTTASNSDKEWFWVPDNSGRQFWEIYGQMVYVSIATMTTAGFGDTYPTVSGSQCFVMLQELCSVFFFSTIVSVGLSTSNTRYTATGTVSGVLSALVSPRHRKRGDSDLDRDYDRRDSDDDTENIPGGYEEWRRSAARISAVNLHSHWIPNSQRRASGAYVPPEVAATVSSSPAAWEGTDSLSVMQEVDFDPEAFEINVK